MIPIKAEATIYSRKVIALDTFEVTLDVSSNPRSFIPGQYMTIQIHGLESLVVPERYRDFSISSSPNDPTKLKTIFRASPSQFKQRLINDPMGTKVEVEWPKGVFTLPDDKAVPVILIAGGVGVTPFLSMIRFMMDKTEARQLTLFYYNRSEESSVCLSELQDYARINRQFVFKPIYGPFDGKPIEDYLRENPASNRLFYIAGPPGMVEQVRSFLVTLNIPDVNIRTEEFSGYASSH